MVNHATAKLVGGWGRRLPRVAGATGALLVTAVVWAGPALAQVSAEPSAEGLPGAALGRRILNWVMWGALMTCLGTFLYGSALWRGGSRTGNLARAADGKDYVLGGAVGAVLAGLGVTVINTLFAAGRSG